MNHYFVIMSFIREIGCPQILEIAKHVSRVSNSVIFSYDFTHNQSIVVSRMSR
jgi:hypothetical protein